MLNRLVRWTPKGLEYEADPRQAESLLQDRGLEGGVRSAGAPGVEPRQRQSEGDVAFAGQTKYRAIAARAKHLSADLPDVQYSAMEICRFMSSPTELGRQALNNARTLHCGEAKACAEVL